MTTPAEDRGNAAGAPKVMLLCLWSGAGVAWHVRLVSPDAQVHEFASPFELAQFLSRQAGRAGEPAATPGGLR